MILNDLKKVCGNELKQCPSRDFFSHATTFPTLKIIKCKKNNLKI